MADASNVSLLPVVVGGLLTMGGAVIGGLVTLGVTLLQQWHDDKKRKAVKFEELVSALYEHYHWLDKAKNIRVFNNEGELGISPIARVLAITTAYFPDLDGKVRELDIAADGYELWMFNARQKMLDKKPNYADGFQEPWKKYLEARSALMTELKAFAEKNLV